MIKMKRDVRYYAADTENNVPKPTIYESKNEVPLVNYRGEFDYLPFDSPDPLLSYEKKSETRVWAVAIGEVSEDCNPEDVSIYSSIFDFLTACRKLKGAPVVYFHNLSYDGPSIVVALLRLGFKETVVEEGEFRNTPRDGEFMVLISGEGIWYSIKVRFPHNHKCVEFRDSLKLLPFSVDKIAKELKTKAQKLKGSIDYTIKRGPEWVITDEEEAYIKNDVLVMMEALAKIKPLGMLEKLTIGSHCMDDFKTKLGNGSLKNGKKIFCDLFPELGLDLDSKLRKSYHGGWCFNNTNAEIFDLRNDSRRIEVYDVNSLYPSVMYSHAYPIGTPMHFDGTEFDEFKDMLYIIRISVDFTIKKDHLPFIQFKNSRWADNEYIRDSEGIVEMTFTKPDFELFLEQYDVSELEILEGWWFLSSSSIFNDYIDYWYEIKKNSSDNKVMRLVAKLHLNNLYGKFATAILRTAAHPYIDEDGILRNKVTDEITKGGYIPVGAFCTAYARCVTIRAAQNNYNNFLYSDTDSIHIIGEAKGIVVGDGLGEWDNESSADMGRFVRQKTYIEHTTRIECQDVEPFWNIKACGAPEEAKERMLYKVTIDGENPVFKRLERDENEKIISPKRTDDEIISRFNFGLIEAGKLMKKRVSGGVILTETTFSIKTPRFF